MYRIKAGHHGAAGLNCRPHFGRQMHVCVIFAFSAHYKPRMKDGKVDAGDLGISKVTGFCGLIPGRTSVRIGWRCTASTPINNVEVWAYYHIAGKHEEQFLCLAACGDRLDLTLVDHGDRYQVKLAKASGFTISDEHAKPWTAPVGWTHSPWFGGQNTAPHDIDIEVINIK